MRSAPIIGIALAACLLATPVHAGITVDVHAHAEVTGAIWPGTPGELIGAMDAEGVDIMILMATPAAISMSGAASTQDLETFFPSATYGSRIKFMYGGTELNDLIHGAGRLDSISDPNRWEAVDPNGVYPRGCPGSDCSPTDVGRARAVDIEIDTTSYYYNLFVADAERARDTGRYVGFGEIAGFHYAQHVGHPYIHFPANHAWMEKLVDIAALATPRPMVIDLHLELDATSRTELEDLLRYAYPKGVKIILEHAGWSTYGTATAAILSSLMGAHPNLYLALKRCHHNGVFACYLDSTHTVKAEWATLITTYADRIMVGSDAKYWLEAKPAGATMNEEYRPDLETLLNYFSGTATGTAIEGGTARTLFGF